MRVPSCGRGPAVLLAIAALLAGCRTSTTGAAPPASPSLASIPSSATTGPSRPAGPTTAPAVRPNASPAPAVPLPRAACGRPGAPLRSFHVRVHPSLLDRTGEATFGRAVRSILCDPRSWIAAGSVRWRYRVGDGLRIHLVPPEEAEQRCLDLIGLSVRRTYSCAGIDQVVINAARWFGGAPYAWGAVPRYRRMLINHEVGHVLGLRHRGCRRDGAPAPVMMQQSKWLTSPDTGKTCAANPWPLPEELARLR